MILKTNCVSIKLDKFIEVINLAERRSFNVVKEEVCVEIEEKKSIFLGYSKKVKSEEEVRMFLDVLRKAHPVATHICYAYVLGQSASIAKSSDDGEPAGTAGVPIMEVIKKMGLTNTLVAVVRYFGGKELGRSGLVKTYGKVATKTLDRADYFTMVECAVYEFRFTYNDFSKVNRYLQENEYPILRQDYADVVRIEAAFPVYLEQDVFGELKMLLGGRFMNNRVRNVFVKFEGKEKNKRK